jgi:hypothetical protein
MDSIEDNINIKEIHDFNLENDEYVKYLKFLNFFFQKESKKDKYTRNFLNGQFILIDKANPKKIIKITPTKFINYHKLYIQLKNYSDLILHKISLLIESKTNINDNHREEFDYLKKKYISFKQKLLDINLINKEFYNEIEKLLNEKIDKSTQLVKYYYKRNEDYSKITVMIPEKIKNELINIFKKNNNKMPNDNEINKIAKKNNISSIEIENWFNWIESTYLYLLVQNEIYKINNLIKTKEDNYDMNSKYMIIKAPVINSQQEGKEESVLPPSSV